MTCYGTVRYERTAHVGTLTLARPAKHNAMNPRMWQELRLLGDGLLADDTLRCLVVTGEGASFSAGIDLVEAMDGTLAEWADRPADDDLVALGSALARLFDWVPRLSCPSVAAVRGHAYGAGFQLALACDFRIFASSARVGLPETRFGLLPDMGATFRLPRIVGDGRARELILLGEIVDAVEAARIGLVHRVVADSDLEAAAEELAARLAAQPPLAVSGARRAIDGGWHRDPESSLRMAVEEQARCLTSEDFKEGRHAMAEDRPPQWKGR